MPSDKEHIGIHMFSHQTAKVYFIHSPTLPVDLGSGEEGREVSNEGYILLSLSFSGSGCMLMDGKGKIFFSHL